MNKFECISTAELTEINGGFLWGLLRQAIIKTLEDPEGVKEDFEDFNNGVREGMSRAGRNFF